MSLVQRMSAHHKQRDPRVDPRPGDTWTSQLTGNTYQVVAVAERDVVVRGVLSGAESAWTLGVWGNLSGTFKPSEAT